MTTSLFMLVAALLVAEPVEGDASSTVGGAVARTSEKGFSHEARAVGRRGTASGAPRPGIVTSPQGSWDAWTILAVGAGVVGVALAIRMWKGARPAGAAPRAVQVLLKTPLSGKHSLCLVRMGRSLLLLGVSSNDVRTLAQVDDSVEVAELLAAIESGRPGSLTSQFTEFFSRASNQFESSGPEPMLGDAPRRADVNDVRGGVRELTQRVRGYVTKTVAETKATSF